MVNNLEGYAEYAVQKKLKAKDRMPVVASAALMVVGLAIWTFIAGWVGPSILIIGIALTIITATRQELEYEYIFVNGDCEISKIVSLRQVRFRRCCHILQSCLTMNVRHIRI